MADVSAAEVTGAAVSAADVTGAGPTIHVPNGAGPLAGRPDLLRDHATRQPDVLALVHDRVGQPLLTCTYRELNDEANRIANALLRAGVRAGDFVAWMGRNSIEVVTFAAGAGKAGCTPIPLNHRLSRTEALAILTGYDVALVWVDAALASVFEGMQDETAVKAIVVFGGAPAHGHVAADSFLDGASTEQPPSPGDALVGSMGGFTSGTTGKPKRIRRLPGVGSTADEQAHIAGIWGAERRVFITSGAISSGASGGYYALALAHGDTVVLQAKFDAEDWWRLVDTYKVSIAYLSPAVCRQICAVPDEVRQRYSLASIHAVFAGAAKWTYALKLAYRDTFPEHTLWEIYGSTELGSNTVMGPEEHWDRPESCGRAVRGVEIVLRDANDNIVTKPYDRGVLYVKGGYASGFGGYEDEPEATAAAIWGEYRTVGDIAYFDDQGYYYICDRLKDMIVTGGVNVYPQEIEALIDRHPAVLECTVFGVPDDTWGERVHAVVVRRPGTELDAEALVAYCQEHLSSEKVPRTVDFVDELPHTLSGKILKRQLRDQYWADTGRLI